MDSIGGRFIRGFCEALDGVPTISNTGGGGDGKGISPGAVFRVRGVLEDYFHRTMG